MGDPAELAELEVLVNKAIRDLGLGVREIGIPKIGERICSLEEDINEILTTKPYIYADLLADDEAVEQKKEELQNELETYRKYREELDQVLEKMILEGGLGIVWKMQ